MKKLLTAIAVAAVFTATINAAEGDAKQANKEGAASKSKSAQAAEHKALRKELTEKYDVNKNGRLDKKEKSQMTPEDQEKWNSVSSAAKAKAAEKDKKDTEKKAGKSETQP